MDEDIRNTVREELSKILKLVDKRVLNQQRNRNVEMSRQHRGRRQNSQKMLKSKSVWHMLTMVSSKHAETRCTY